MIKKDLVVTITDAHNEPTLKLTTVDDAESVLFEMLETNKNKFNILEVEEALDEIRAFRAKNVLSTQTVSEVTTIREIECV